MLSKGKMVFHNKVVLEYLLSRDKYAYPRAEMMETFFVVQMDFTTSMSCKSLLLDQHHYKR